MKNRQKKIIRHVVRLLLLSATIFILFQLPGKTTSASVSEVYKDGIYCYNIVNESSKEVRLIGMEQTGEVKELSIPGTAMINGSEYKVAEIRISYQYYDNEAYSGFYKNVEKLTIADNFTGKMRDLIYAFPKVRTIEFKGSTPPAEAEFEITNGCTEPDIIFIVPEGTKAAYATVIEEIMMYSAASDLYEHQIELNPTIITASATLPEKGCFNYGNFIFQVTASAKTGAGTVKLIGIQKINEDNYLSLPKQVDNDGYTYKLTKLCKFSLVSCGAHAIVIPDTVVEMEPAVFDKHLELLFLSKNCKKLPNTVITDENNESNLRFVYVPEGVTTISDNAFTGTGPNKASIILPDTVKSIGKKSLLLFRQVTFLNKKPMNNISASIAKGTTIKVDASSINKYKAVLGSKAYVIAAKKVVKTGKLTTADQSLKLRAKHTYNEKASLSKTSNETIFWLSTNTDIVTVSNQGVITAKKTGIAYVLAYTRTSGFHKAIKVTVIK
jgi:hypothetical protein